MRLAARAARRIAVAIPIPIAIAVAIAFVIVRVPPDRVTGCEPNGPRGPHEGPATRLFI